MQAKQVRSEFMIKKVRVSTFLVRQPLAFVASLVPYCTLAFRHSDSEPEASDNRLTHQVFLQTFESGDYHLQQSCFAEAPFSATRLILVPHVADPGQYSLSQIIVPGGRDTLKVKGWPSPTGAKPPLWSIRQRSLCWEDPNSQFEGHLPFGCRRIIRARYVTALPAR